MPGEERAQAGGVTRVGVSCIALFGEFVSPNWIGGSELSTLIWLSPFWVCFGVMIWKWIEQSIHRPDSDSDASEKSKSHESRYCEDKHANPDNADQYPKAAYDLVEDGMNLNWTMLHQPCDTDIRRDGGGHQDRSNRATLPKERASGVLDDSGDAGCANSVTICSNSIHVDVAEQDSLFFPNVRDHRHSPVARLLPSER